MTRMLGADADELDRLAAEFRRAADELDADGGQLTRLLNSVDWLGSVATRFVGDWTGVRLPQIGLSTRFLRDAADRLAANAQQQRSASNSHGGSAAPVVVPSPGSSGRTPEADTTDLLGVLESLLDDVSTIGDIAEVLPAALELAFGAERAAELLETVFRPELLGAIEKVGKVADVVNVIVSVAADFVAHPELPTDERLLHAVTVGALELAVSGGISAAATALGAMIGSVVPVAGTAVGAVAGFVIGKAAEYGVDKLDDAVGGSEYIADLVVDDYRWKRDLVLGAGRIVTGAADIVADAGAAAIDTVVDVGEAVVDAGGAVLDVVVDVGGSILNPVKALGRLLP